MTSFEWIQPAGKKTALMIGGVDVANLIAVDGVSVQADRVVPRVELRLLVTDLRVHFDVAKIEVDAATEKLLNELGWTAPGSGI